MIDRSYPTTVTVPTSPDTRAKALRLLADGVPLSGVARACGLNPRTVMRIRDSIPSISPDEQRVIAAVGDIRRVVLGPELADSIEVLPSGPFSGAPQEPANVPTLNWSSDQPPPAIDRPFDPRYHGHSFQSFSAPLSFDGWNLERIRAAISVHRQGNFLESSTLSMVVCTFAPVMAAIGQRMAPALALPRHIVASNRGLSRILGAEIERQLAPNMGLSPSRYFPPTLWGTMAFDLATMGFSVLQTVLSEPDPVTGVRYPFTRRWPIWAVQYYRYRRTFVAITTEGHVDILNDGKFTLVADSDEPQFLGPIVALAEEFFDGKCNQRQRAAYIDRYANPKLVSFMPEKAAPNTPEGAACFAALGTVMSPDGTAVFPFGTKLEQFGLESGRSTVLKDALESNWQHIAAIELGSDGTMTRGTGVYSAPIFAGVRRDLVDRDLQGTVRGVNCSHVRSFLEYNYSASIAESKGWIDPYLSIPLPDPDADARIQSYANRLKSFHENVKLEREAGFEITQERIEQLAKEFEISHPILATQPEKQLALSVTDTKLFTTIDEARYASGLDLLGGDRGSMFLAEVEQKAKAESNSNETSESSEEKPQDGSAEASSARTGMGGSTTGGESPGQEDDTTGGPDTEPEA